MNQSLTRMLSLICLHLNERARTHLADLLPESLQPEVREWHRGGSVLITGELTPAERRVLSLFGSAESEGETESESLRETDDPKFESFFSEAEERMERAVELAPAAAEGSLLPASLISLILLNASPEEAARLLVELPLTFQGQSIDLIVTGSAMDDSSLEREESDLVEALRSHLSAESWGVESAVRILRAIGTTRRLRRAIEAIAAINSAAVSILQNQLFIFEDVTRIDDREFQVLLGRVDNQTLARAMKDASDAVRDRFLGNMSDRRVTLVSEEGQLLEELTVEEADMARKRVLEALRQLYEDGYIQTYFGSVQTRHEPDEEDAADDIEMEEGEVAAETDPEEPPPVYVPQERETAAAAKQPSRKRSAYLVAAGCVAGAVLVTIGVLHFAMRDQPRTLQGKKAGHEKRRDLSLVSGAGKAVVVQ